MEDSYVDIELTEQVINELIASLPRLVTFWDYQNRKEVEVFLPCSTQFEEVVKFSSWWKNEANNAWKIKTNSQVVYVGCKTKVGG